MVYNLLGKNTTLTNLIQSGLDPGCGPVSVTVVGPDFAMPQLVRTSLLISENTGSGKQGC